MKRKTQVEYIEKVAKINPNIEVIGDYVNAKTKILHKCKIDNHEWYATPSNIFAGRGCPECGKIIKIIKKSKNNDWYITEVYKANPNIEVLGTYNGYDTKILHKCKIDKYEWYTSPSVILGGSGCPKCASLARLQKTQKNS